jgi:DNA-binding NarL/FixJ family response regulator
MRQRAVVVAHRAAMVAEGLAAALARFPGIVPVAVATTAAEGVRYGERADAVAIDERLEGADDAARALRRRGVRVVLIGEASGEEPSDEENGGVRVSARSPVASLAWALAPGVPSPGRGAAALSRREREVLALVASGMPAKQVARQLGISPKTVEQHKSRIFSKLGVRNQVAAVRAALGARLEGSLTWSRSST